LKAPCHTENADDRSKPIIGMDAPVSSISGIILAGGGSRRMGGINKALLHVGGRPIIQRAARTLSQVLREVIVITNAPEEHKFLGLPLYRDLVPGGGALGGLYTGLSKCSGRYAFLVGCDMPFLNEGVIAYMVSIALADQYDVVVPRINGRLQPMHAIYGKNCLDPTEQQLKGDDLRILNFFTTMRVLEVQESELSCYDPHCRFVMNINTPDELEMARQLAE
jgi:molybdopterin-guanine dinucleotide biosynthesis protein A